MIEQLIKIVISVYAVIYAFAWMLGIIVLLIVLKEHFKNRGKEGSND